MFIVPAGIAAYLFSEGKNRIPSYFNYKKPKNTRILGLSILLIFVSMPAVSLLGALNADLQLPESMAAMELKMKAMETQAQTLVESFLITDSTSVFIANLLIVAVIPAIGEELLFRGTIQRILGEWFKNKHVAIITTAALFSFIHFQFYGFLPRMVLGIIFGYLFIWSKNIFYPILAHFINNALGVTAYFYMTELKNTSVGKTLEIGEQTSTIDNSLIIVGMISLGLIGLILYTIRKEAPEPLTNQPEPEES